MFALGNLLFPGVPLCATPLSLMAAAASGTCWKPLKGGGSLLWTLVQRRCWALQAASISSFEVSNIPLTLCSEHISSLSLSLSPEWESVTDKAQGQGRVSWLRHQVVWEGAGLWLCCHRAPASGSHFVAPAAQTLGRVLFSGFPNQLQEPRGHSEPVLDGLLWGIQ